MFDYFVEQNPTKESEEPPSLHIIHVAHGYVDDTDKPEHNFNYLLDDVTMETLPEELRKVCLC